MQPPIARSMKSIAPQPIRKKLYVGIAVVIGVIIVLGIVVYFLAASVGSRFNDDVSAYVQRSDVTLKKDDYKRADAMKALTDSAPQLAWIPFGGINAQYSAAQSKQAALDFYTKKTFSLTTDQQDTSYRDKLAVITKAMMKQYADNADAYGKSSSPKDATFTYLQAEDIAYFDKQLTVLESHKAKITSLATNSFSEPLQAYAVYQIDKTIAALNERKEAVSNAKDSSIYSRIAITSQFENNRQTYYLYRLSSLTNSMYYYSWRELLQKQLASHLGSKMFSGSSQQVKTAAAIAYDTAAYEAYLPTSLEDKNFDYYSMIAKYQAFLLQRTLADSSTPPQMKQRLTPLVDAVVADSRTLAFDVETSNRLMSISGVYEKMIDGLSKINIIINDGKNDDEGRAAFDVLLAKYPRTDYYRSSSEKITKTVKECVEIRIVSADLRNRRDEIRSKLNTSVTSNQEYAAMRETFKELDTIDTKVDAQDEKYDACLRTIDPILAEFAKKQNAYSEYRTSLVTNADKLVAAL